MKQHGVNGENKRIKRKRRWRKRKKRINRNEIRKKENNRKHSEIISSKKYQRKMAAAKA